MSDNPFDAPNPEPAPQPASPAPRAPMHGTPESDLTSISFYKVALIAGLAVATVLPNMFISNLIEEREARQQGVQREFVRQWGPEQKIYTPVLVLPYQSSGNFPRQYVKIATARLDVVADLKPEERRRGLFHATVYDAKVEMQGTIVVPPETRLREYLNDKDGRFVWNEAFIAFGTQTALTGLRSSDKIAINGTDTPWQACREATRHERACQNAAIVIADVVLQPTTTATTITFKSTVSLRGTGSFSLLNASKELNAVMRAPWSSPSFSGDALPASSTVTPESFEARWEIAEFGSPRVTASSAGIIDPALWKGATVGVDLIEATPIYRMITRVAKYGLLFVVLSFATYFFFELLARLRIHVVQYGLLGLSLSLFSLLLLSLAEPIGYTQGYLVAAGLVLAQASLYTAAVTRRFLPTLAFTAMLSSLFAFLYVLLGLETYSLLVGAFALFAVVSVLMVLTQWMAWSPKQEEAAA